MQRLDCGEHVQIVAEGAKCGTGDKCTGHATCNAHGTCVAGSVRPVISRARCLLPLYMVALSVSVSGPHVLLLVHALFLKIVLLDSCAELAAEDVHAW